MRTFLAFELPDEEKERIFEKIEQYAATKAVVNWVALQNLHITLQFIGETNPCDIAQIFSKIREKFEAVSAFNILSQGIEIIPMRKPRIIWNAYQTNQKKIYKAYHGLQFELQNLGYEIDSRKLKLHSTLGRVKKALPQQLVQLILNEKKDSTNVKISKITLYESKLRREGPVYIPIESFVLSDVNKGILKDF